MTIVEVADTYRPEIFTSNPDECDLSIGFTLLDALSSHSLHINTLVQRIMGTWEVHSSQEKWEKAIAWIRTHSEDIQEDLKNISLIIIAGPMELSPVYIRFRVHDKESSFQPFDRSLPGWHQLKPVIVDRRGVTARRVSIPSQLLDALHIGEQGNRKMVSPGTIGLHDLYLRYGWAD